MSKDTNYGIIIGDGGNFTSSNTAVGENATINSSGDQSIGIVDELAELGEIFSGVELEDHTKTAALEAVDTLKIEAEKGDDGNSDSIRSALGILEGIGKASSALVPLADRLFPLLTRLNTALL